MSARRRIEFPRSLSPLLTALAMLLLALRPSLPLHGEVWSDLEEPEYSGSEAEGHYPFNLGYLAYYESWTNEQGKSLKSINVFHLWKFTYYPKYTSVRFFPLYYSQHSTIDSRRRRLIFPLYYDQVSRDGKGSMSFLLPVYYHEYKDEQNSFFLSLLYGSRYQNGDVTRWIGPVYWGKDSSKDVARGGLFPIIQYRREGRQKELLLHPLLGHFEWGPERSVHLFPLLPLLHYYSRDQQADETTFYFIPFYRSKKSDERSRFHILPVYFSGADRSPDMQTDFQLLLPLFYLSSRESKSAKDKKALAPVIPLLFYYSRGHNQYRSYDTLWVPGYFSYNDQYADTDAYSRGRFIPGIYYSSEEKDRSGRQSSYTNIALLYNRSKSTDPESGAASSSYSVLPFFYSGEGKDRAGNTYDSLWVTGYYSWNNKSVVNDTESSGWLIPLLFYNSSSTEKQGRHSSYRNIALLYNRSKSSDPESGAASSSYSVLPFFYSGEGKDRAGNTYDSLWVTGYYSWDNKSAVYNTTSSGSMFPLLFYNSSSTDKHGRESSYSNIALLYNRSKTKDPESGAESSSYSVLPFFYSTDGKDSAGNTYDSLWVTGYYSWDNKSAANDTASSGWLFPLLYYSSNERDKNGKESSYSNIALLYNRSTSSDPESGAASSSYSVLPFFYSTEGKDRAGNTYDSLWATGYYSWDNKSVVYNTTSSGNMFPLLFYNSSSTDKHGRESSYRNIALLYNRSTSSDPESGAASSSYSVLPFFYSTEGKDRAGNTYDSLWATGYYSWDNKSAVYNTTSSGWLIPLLFYNSSSTDKYGRESSYRNIALLYNRSTSKDPESGAASSSYSVLPFFYSTEGKDRAGNTYDSLWATGYYSWDNKSAVYNTTSSGNFIPLFFYNTSSTDKHGRESSYRNIALLYNRSTSKDPESGAASSSYSVLPFFYSTEGKDRAGNTYDSLWATGYYSWDNKSTANDTASSGWLFPLLFYNSSSTDKHGRESSYRNIALLYNRSTSKDPESGAASSSYSVLPFFYSTEGKDRAGNTYDSLWATGYYSWDNKSTANDTASSGWLFPLLYYSSNDRDKNGKESSYSNIALLWNSSSSQERESGHFTQTQHFLPLYFYSKQDGITGSRERLWALSFYQWDLNSQTEERSTGSFLLPFYYHSEKKDSSFWMLSPLYWSSTNPETSEAYRLSPIHYGHQWREGDSERYTNWTLLFFNWSHEESEGATIFPFYYRFKDEEKEWELYAMGAVTTADAMLRIRGDSIYLDTDTYVGYGLVGWSSRLPVYDSGAFQRWMRKTEQTTETNETTVVGERSETGESADTTPQIHNDRLASFDRENTSSYSKFQMLFGWVTKIQADTRHHFRFLPLAWVSWDDANKNEYLKYYPFLGLDYSTPEEQYTALFPLFIPVYGRHTKGESFTVSYGGPFYIRSYDAEKDEHDLYAPWPFFNRYSDPTKSGTRLIPLFAYRKWKDEEGQHSRWITLLSYHRTTENGDSTSYLTMSPVYLSSTQFEHEDDPQRKSGKGWTFILPAITKTFDQKGSSWNALFVAGGSGTYDDSESFHYFFPIYSYFRDRKERSFRYIWPLGRIYAEGLSEDGSAADNGSYFFPLYAQRSWNESDGEHNRSFSLLHYHHSSEKEKTTFLLPLLYYSDADTSGSSWNIALLTGGSERTNGDRGFYLFPFYSYSRDVNRKETSHSFLWPLGRIYRAGTGENESPAESGWYLFPLYAQRSWNANDGQHNRSFSLLHYHHSSEKEKTTFLLPLLYYSDADTSGSSWNIALLTGGSERTNGDRGFYLFPFYSYSRDVNRKETSHSFLWPLGRIYSAGTGENESPAESGWYLFPLYAQRSWNANDGQHNRSFSLLHYHHSSEKEKTTFLLPLLYYSDADTSGSSWNIALLTGGSERTNGDRGFYLFPFYSYSRDVNRKATSHSFLWPLGRIYSTAKGENESPAESGWYLFPLYAQRSWNANDGQHNRSFSLLHYHHVSDRESSTFVLPFLYYRESNATSSEWNFALLSGGSSDRDGSSSLFLFPVYSYTRDERKKETDHTVLWFFGRAYSYGAAEKEDSGFYLFPVFAQREYSDREGRHNRSFSLLHYWRRSSHDEGRRSSYFLSPLYSYESDESGSSSWRFALLFSGSSSADGRESDISFFPLYSNRRTQKGENSETSSYFLFPLWKSYTSETKQRSEIDRFVLWPLFRYNRESASGLNTTRLRFYPLFYYTKEEGSCENCDNSYTTLFPLFFRGREKKAAGIESTDFVLGFYRHSTAQTAYHNFFYLYEYESEPAYSKLNLLLGMYHQESSQRKNQDIFRMQMLYGLLVDADYYGSTSGYAGGYDTRWLLYYQRNNAPGERDAFTSALFPLWRYHSNREESSFLFVPTLSYHTRTGDNAFDCDVLCLGWIRSKDGNSYDNWLLAGLLYLEQGRAERGWQSYGAGWNLLGRYQRESETGYYSFSLLGGLYGRSRIESKGYASDLYLWGVLYGRESDRTEGFDKHSFLWGALYGSESRANGYRRQSVLWGLLFEDLEDPDKAYKSWSILQGIIYSNVDNGRTNINYRRILGLQILKGPGR